MQPLRVRLTVLYAGVLAVATGVLLTLCWLLLRRQLDGTLPPPSVDAVMSEVTGQFVLAAVGLVIVAATAGWLLAGPLLERVEAAAERQRRFVANASHELRTPLTVIRTEVDVTLDDPDADVEDLRRMGAVVAEATIRTEHLIDGLLVLAGVSHGAVRSEPVELAALTVRLAARMAPEADAAGVRFDVDAETAWTNGDPALLERVVENLLENAIRHGARADGWTGGHDAATRVVVRPGATIEVSNDGPVISPELVSRLGEPFQRLDRGRADRGSGLGLSIVRAVAEAHGGALALTAPPTGGLSARVALPAGQPVAVPVPSRPTVTAV